MNRRLRPAAWLLGVALGTGLAGGCVERRYVICSDPPGAIVYENERPVGAAPADHPFGYYGTYRFKLVHDGYETLVVDQPIPAPWYEYFPLDFISENVIPWTIRDVRRYTYRLEPMRLVPPEELLQRAQEERARGRTVGVPLPPTATPAGPVPPPALAPPVPTPPAPAGAVSRITVSQG